MSAARKLIAIVAVYAVTLAAAWAVGAALSPKPGGPDDPSAGMAAFGDVSLMLGLFLLAGVAATVAAVRIWRAPP